MSKRKIESATEIVYFSFAKFVEFCDSDDNKNCLGRERR
jgi:hypothetical protein